MPQPPQHRLNAQAAQFSTSKVPPYWSPELELQGYPFRTYLQDVRIWSSSSELAVEAQGGAVVQRLGGVARQFAPDVDPNVLRNGRAQLDAMGQQVFDLQGNPVLVSGLEMLLNGFARKFGAREFETSVSSVIEILAFRRLPREPIDDCLGRFELTRKRPTSSATSRWAWAASAGCCSTNWASTGCTGLCCCPPTMGGSPGASRASRGS